MIESIIQFWESLPLYSKTLIGFMMIGFVLSLIKKLLKIAVLFALLILIVVAIFKLTITF